MHEGAQHPDRDAQFPDGGGRVHRGPRDREVGKRQFLVNADVLLKRNRTQRGVHGTSQTKEPRRSHLFPHGRGHPERGLSFASLLGDQRRERDRSLQPWHTGQLVRRHHAAPPESDARTLTSDAQLASGQANYTAYSSPRAPAHQATLLGRPRRVP